MAHVAFSYPLTTRVPGTLSTLTWDPLVVQIAGRNSKLLYSPSFPSIPFEMFISTITWPVERGNFCWYSYVLGRPFTNKYSILYFIGFSRCSEHTSVLRSLESFSGNRVRWHKLYKWVPGCYSKTLILHHPTSFQHSYPCWSRNGCWYPVTGKRSEYHRDFKSLRLWGMLRHSNTDWVQPNFAWN